MVSSGGGAIPIGRNAKEQEIGATDISGTGLAHRTAPNDTTLQPAKDRLDPGRHRYHPEPNKSAETHSGLRFAVPGVAIGAGWVRRGENGGTDHKPLARGARVRAAQALNQTFPALPARTVTASSP